MPKPPTKDKNQKQNIVGKALKDIIPSSYPHIQDLKEIEYPPQGEKVYSPENLPIELYPEWPSNETDLENLLKPLIPENIEENEIEKYIDPNNSKVLLPIPLFVDYLNMSIKWSPPEKYIIEFYLDKLIQKQMPKKNSYKFRLKIHESYQEELKIRKKKLEEANEENELNENKNEESEEYIDNKDEFLIFRDFFKILDKPLDIQVVNFVKRTETEEELLERLKKLEEEYHLQNDKGKKNKTRTSKNLPNDVVQEKMEITKPSPTNINLKEKIPPFFRWLGSIFQIIKDRNLVDVKTGENIWAKIYPQKNGVPIYNKNGHYIIKLHHMGKLRAIDIDDRMPLSDRDEYFFPRCENLEELWPALLTKALLKLYSYKIISSTFNEIGDLEPFYALTGYIPTLLKEITFDKNNNNKSPNQSKVEEIESKKEESSNKENKQIENDNNINNENEINEKNKDANENEKKEDENNINKNNEKEEKNDDSLENIENEENKKNEEHQKIKEEKNQNENIPPEKLSFFEKAMTDENYSNKNYLIECFRSIDGPFYKIQNDLLSLEEEEEEEIINYIHESDNTQENKEEEKENENNNPINKEESPEIKIKDNNIENLKDDIKSKSTLKQKSKFIDSIKARSALTYDLSSQDVGKTQFKYLNEKLQDYSMENNLYKGILYNIVDFFDNKNYNMDRLQPIDFSDLKAMLKNFNKNNVFKQLNREEKKDYIVNLKKIKEQQKMLKAKRIENLKLKGEQYYAMKIENNGIDKTNYNSKYTDVEIQMAKKCLLNKWDFPPMEYLDERYEEKKKKELEEKQKELEMEEKKIKMKKSLEKRLSKKVNIITDINKEKEKEKKEKKEKNEEENDGKEKRTWSKEIYMQLIDNNLDQFKHNISPLQRNDGSWMEGTPFFNIFDKFLVLYNPSRYNTTFDWDNYWYETNDILTPKDENSILHLKKINLMEKIEMENKNNKNDKKDKTDKTERLSKDNSIKNKIPCNYIVMMYEAISDKNNKLRNFPYKINFRFIKKEDKIESGKIIKINSFYGSERIDGLEEDSEYFLIFDGGIFPEGFYVQVISDFLITPLNWQNFLSNHLGYNKQTFHVEHNALEKNEIYVLLRVSIINETRSKFMIISNNTKDKYSNEYIKLYICNSNNSNIKKLVEFKTFFELNPGEYMFVMTINPIYVLEPNSYDVDILFYSEFSNSMMMDISQTNTAVPGEQNKPIGITMEKVETVAPYEIIDNYHINKNNILFKEFIFAGDKINALLHIKIVKLLNDENNEGDVSDRNKQKNKPTEEIRREPLNELIRLKLELFNKENELILSEDFYNEITLHNLSFEGNIVQENPANKNKKPDKKNTIDLSTPIPPSNLPYSLICTIDTSEAPRQYMEPDFLKNIGWSIRVFSTDTLGFCQDTSKEDKEKEIIASWEEKEPGRAELAKKSRRRFLLEKKLENGKQLNEEEKSFLKEERIRKTFNKENEEEIDDKNKGKKKNEKIDKSKKKGKEPEKTEIDKDKENFANLNLQINYNKKTSNVINHSSLYIKNFLSYAYDNRMLTFNNNYEQEEKELNNEILTTEKEEKINAEYLESEKQNTEKMNLETKKREEFKKNNRKMLDKMMNQRKKEVEECKSFYQTRTSLAMNIQNKISVEKKCSHILESLLQNDHNEEDTKNKKKKPGEGCPDLEEAIHVYNEAINIGLKSNVVEKLFDEISVKKEEAYKSELNKLNDPKNKNKDLKGFANKILDEIQNHKWKISKAFIEELNKMKSSS